MMLTGGIISNFCWEILVLLARLGGRKIIGTVFEWQFKKGKTALDNGKHTEGVYIFEKLSKKDHSESQYELGKIYYDGNYGFNKNFRKAWLLFRKAANQEMEQAQFYIGELYYYGKGILQNRYKAIEYWEQAAIIKNYPPAQFMLAYLHFEEKEYEKAKEYCKEVIKENLHGYLQYNSQANFMLGVLYAEEKKYAKTREHWEKSAYEGLKITQYTLGTLYFHGAYEFPRNNMQAYIWFSIALGNEYSDAKEYLNKIKLTDDRIIKAQEKIDDMKEKNLNLIRPQSDFDLP